MNKTIISVLVAVVIAGGGGFYGGMKYQESQGGTGFPGSGNFQNLSESERADLSAQDGGPRGENFGGGAGGNNRAPGQGGLSFGEVLSVDDSSMVIQLPNDAGTKIVFYSDSTAVSKQASGSISDVVVGETVTIMGESNDDGSIVANTIQLVPEQQ